MLRLATDFLCNSEALKPILYIERHLPLIPVLRTHEDGLNSKTVLDRGITRKELMKNTMMYAIHLQYDPQEYRETHTFSCLNSDLSTL